MINSDASPVSWVLLIDELAEAQEHLDKLIAQMRDEGSVDEEDFAVQLGHVYAHLNRAWHSRDLTSQITDDQWSSYSQFPTDLEPVG